MDRRTATSVSRGPHPPTRAAIVAVAAVAALAGGCGAGAQSTRQVQLDPARLLADLSALAHDSMRGRETGSPGAASARAFIQRSLEQAGVDPIGDSYIHPFASARGTGLNVVALIPGEERPQRYIVLTAHYDHEGVRDGEIYNGADDNASGVAALLEAARIVSTEPLRHSLILVATDAEESGLRGARAFVADPPVPPEAILLNVNLDMVSRAEGVLWAGGAYHTPALRPVLEAVAAEPPLTLRLGHDRPNAPEGDDWTNASDHGPFHEAGIPFVYFGVEDHADYHRPTDDFERIDPGEYVAAVRTILAALRALDEALPLEP